jgi:hypothetical protein
VPADRRLSQHVPGDREQHQHQNGAVGDVRLTDREGVAEEGHRSRHPGHRLVLRVDVSQRERDVQGAQGDDERRQLDRRHQAPVDETEGRTDGKAKSDGQEWIQP